MTFSILLAQDPCGNVRVSSDDSTSRNMNPNDTICPQGKCPWQVSTLRFVKNFSNPC